MLYKTAFFCYNMCQFEGVVKMEKIPYDYVAYKNKIGAKQAKLTSAYAFTT